MYIIAKMNKLELELMQLGLVHCGSSLLFTKQLSLLLEREKGREGERRGEKHQSGASQTHPDLHFVGRYPTD